MCGFDRSYLPALKRAIEEVLTTRAAGAARRAGISCIVSAKCPRWFVPNWVSNPSAVLPSGTAMTPALLNSRSILGWTAFTAAANSAIAASEPRSSLTTSSDAPGTAASTAFRAVSALSRLRAPITTWAPWAAR